MKTKGFTLIEVLIAMLILAVGLLGLATLQTYSLRSNLSAYTRGQATQLLYDMSDRIRANYCKTTSTITCGTQSNYLVATTTSLGSSINQACYPTSTPSATYQSSCTAAILASNDLIEWKNAITAILPMGRACIAQGAAANIFNLYITWDDNRSGAVMNDQAVPTGCNSSFSSTPTSADSVEDPRLTMSIQL